jgi:hypothetical protein
VEGGRSETRISWALRQHASTFLVVALLAGTAVAFVVTERLKLEVVPVEPIHVSRAVSPVCGCSSARASLRFLVRRADVITLKIVDANGRTVSELIARRYVRPGRPAFSWNGRDSDGRIVPDGVYHVLLGLGREARTIKLPQAITIDTVPPAARLVSFSPHVIARGARARVVVTYRLSERAHAVVFVDGVKRVVTYSSVRSGKLQWFATRDGKRLRPGRYRFQLAGFDAAGNLGARTRPFFVRVD